MKTPVSSHKKDAGFTLLEIMIAVTIISFMMGIVYTTFSTISQSDKRTAISHELTLKARNLIELITRDISSVYLPAGYSPAKNQSDSNLQYAFIGNSEETEGFSLDFITSDADPERPDDIKIKEVGYFTVRSGQEGLTLFKREDDTPDDNIREGGRSYEVMAGLNSLSFEFMNNRGEWKNDWNTLTGGSLPAGVKVEFSLIGEEMLVETFSFQIPIYMGKLF